MVEKDVFGYISRISGLSLTVSDLSILADCTECNPLAERINVNVIFDCLQSHNMILNNNEKRTDRKNQHCIDNDDDYFDQNNLNIELLSESALFALKHISGQIWRAADIAARY